MPPVGCGVRAPGGGLVVGRPLGGRCDVSGRDRERVEGQAAIPPRAARLLDVWARGTSPVRCGEDVALRGAWRRMTGVEARHPRDVLISPTRRLCGNGLLAAWAVSQPAGVSRLPCAAGLSRLVGSGQAGLRKSRACRVHPATGRCVVLPTSAAPARSAEEPASIPRVNHLPVERINHQSHVV